MKILPRRWVPKSIFFYCFITTLFVIGYLLGFLHSTGHCVESPDSIEKSSNLNKVIKQSALVVVVIFTAPSNYDRRKVIRETWLSSVKVLNLKHFFVVGSASLDLAEIQILKGENEEHKDLLILNSVSDSYTKLSRKLLEVFRWLDINVEYTFLLKVDDDSYVRLNALYVQMTKQPSKKLYWGFFDGQARVKTKGKWKEKSWFLCDRYLPYARGGGYIITSDLVHNLVLTSNSLALYQSEDVTLGTWLAPYDLKRLHDTRFDTEYVSRGCFNSYLVTHKQSTLMMTQKHEHLRQTGNMCLSEIRNRNSYNYNWKVLPSLCCFRNNTQIP